MAEQKIRSKDQTDRPDARRHFLRSLLGHRRVCIQCHNNPDADTLAAALGVYRYLSAHGVDAFLVYGGLQPIKKFCLKLLIQECGIPIAFTHSPEDFDLLLMVDCQYGQGNAQRFAAEQVAIIDHHIQVVEPRDSYFIDSMAQSCSTLVWELLQEEDYPVAEDPTLSAALLYGLYTDTSCFADLFAPRDMAMRTALFTEQPLFERLIKSCMSVAELLIASDAMLNHYFDAERRFAVVEALSCDQSILGIIGDFMIQVDVVNLSVTYTENDIGYQISLRSCLENLPANQIAAWICDGIGGGGGHRKKAGGRIILDKMQKVYGERSIFDVVNLRLCQYLDEGR